MKMKMKNKVIHVNIKFNKIKTNENNEFILMKVKVK